MFSVVLVVGLVLAAAVAFAIVVIVVVVLLRRRASGAAPEPVAAPHARPERPADLPMSGLEAALAQVTGRDGRPIGERIDAEAQHVDDLRVPDDTGPLLRRALDHVEHRDHEAPRGATETP